MSAAALAEACLRRTLDYGHGLNTEERREGFAPWFHALDVASERDPLPESLAAMARLPRACGRYLDLADVRAEQGDFATAVGLVEQGLAYEPNEVTLGAASAACRARLAGSSDDLRALITLAPEIVNATDRNLLIVCPT